MTNQPTLETLEKFFKETELPKQVGLNYCTVITDTEKFIESSFATLKSNSGNKTFMPYYERLVKLKEILSNK
jgi:hypothetical protein